MPHKRQPVFVILLTIAVGLVIGASCSDSEQETSTRNDESPKRADSNSSSQKIAGEPTIKQQESIYQLPVPELGRVFVERNENV